MDKATFPTPTADARPARGGLFFFTIHDILFGRVKFLMLISAPRKDLARPFGAGDVGYFVAYSAGIRAKADNTCPTPRRKGFRWCG
jgi:hypothetical protein